MALGGWAYNSTVVYSRPATYEGLMGVLEQITAEFETTAGWSQHTPATNFYGGLDSNSSAYAISQHTGGAWLAWIWGNYTFSVHASNMANNATYIASSGREGMLLVAYLPAGHSGVTGIPSSAGFIPSDGFRFFQVNYAELRSWQQQGFFRLHFMTQDDDVILALERDAHLSSDIDYVTAMGTFLSTRAHASDTSSEVQLNWDQQTVDRYPGMVQCFAADGSLRTTTLGGYQVAVNETPLERSIYDREPRSWSQGVVHGSHVDLDTYGIVAGNAIKGVLDPERVRFSQTGLHSKQPAEDKYFIHTTQGILVGWDPSHVGME